MNIIFGGRGRLGSALATGLGPQKSMTPDRSVYAEWWRPESVPEIINFLSRNADSNSVVYIATGIIQPSRDPLLHEKVNYLLPTHVVEAAEKLKLRVVTFGSVMEGLAYPGTVNAYLASKVKFSQFVMQKVISSVCPPLHIRIHTIYGGRAPDPFMFLGQMLDALESGVDFKMSPGYQLREYHHVDDEVRAITLLAENERAGALNLSHGKPITLREMALAVFGYFDRLDSLKLGALPAPLVDNFSTRFEATELPGKGVFRDTIPSVIDYLRCHLKRTLANR